MRNDARRLYAFANETEDWVYNPKLYIKSDHAFEEASLEVEQALRKQF